jgi:glycosyltransferase involved in cell wall biosynthesis
VPIQVIPNGFNAPPQISATERHDRVLVVARMFERKGVQYLIEALGHIKTDWECWIIGDGPYRPTLQKRADQCGVSAKFLSLWCLMVVPMSYTIKRHLNT